MNKKMKKVIVFLITIVIFLYSCNKDDGILNNSKSECINSFIIPNFDSIKTNSYFKGEIRNQPVNIYDGDGNFTFQISSIIRFTSFPGEWINPKSDSLTDAKVGLTLIFKQNVKDSFPTYFSLETPFYDKNTPFVEIIDNISKQKSLIIGDDENRINNGYTFNWHISCEKYDLSPICFATGAEWLWDYYYDQEGKWIKVINFSKEKTIFGQWEYDITFDINVNIFTVRGYYGEAKGIFKTHFLLNE